MNEWVDGWIEEWVNERTDGGTDERTNEYCHSKTLVVNQSISISMTDF